MKIFLSGNLQLLRERKKRSQADMAAFIGISRSDLNNYENGNSQPPLEKLLKISEYFGIGINTLLSLDFSKLPYYHFPLLSKNKKYRMFQLSGDSMLPLRDRSWITCEYMRIGRKLKTDRGMWL